MKEIFFNQSKKFFIDDLEKITSYVKENCIEEVETIINKANEVVNQTFLFNLRWDMEYTDIPVHFDKQIDWLCCPGDDVEWTFAFNRHHYWINLGQAYQCSKDEKYAQTFVHQCSDWIKRVQLKDEQSQNAWRTIEAGLRINYWLKALCYFKDSPSISNEFMELFLNSIEVHAEYILNTDSSTHVVSNWGVLENQGLFIAGVMLPTTSRTQVYIDTAITRLSKQMQAQVYPDGVHWEQSTMYHNEVTQCFLDVCILAARNDIQMPSAFLDRLYKMCLFSLHHSKPNHFEIEMGDSDTIDIRDILNKGSYLFHCGILKSMGNLHLDFDSVWDLGFQASLEYNQIESKKLSDKMVGFIESGQYFIRSDYSEEGTYLHFNNGTHGGGHAHSDKLHLDLFANGEDILIDSGRYTYVNKPERFEFKDAHAHNVCLVDDLDSVVHNKSWGYKKRSLSVNQKMIVEEPYCYLEGGHLGYMDQGVYINRKVVYLKADLIVIMDEFYSKDKHTYDQYFHFNDIGCVNLSNNKAVYKSGLNEVDFVWPDSGISQSLLATRTSHHYNVATPNSTIKTQIQGDGFASVITVISINKVNEYENVSVDKVPISYTFSGKEIPSDVMEAITIKKGSKQFTMTFAHEDYLGPSDTFSVNGFQGLGHMVIFDHEEEKFLGKTLVY